MMRPSLCWICLLLVVVCVHSFEEACLNEQLYPPSNSSSLQKTKDHQPAQSVVAAGDPLVDALMDWLRSKGALINAKIEVRHVVRDDPSTTRGIFAKDGVSLQEGEVILSIPWHLIIASEEYQDDCDTMLLLRKQMAASDPTPYIQLLLQQPRNLLPPLWSEEGQDFLREMNGPHLDSFWDDPEGISCQDDMSVEDPLDRLAWEMVSSRADDHVLVPLYDMLNHRNGKHTNTLHAISEGVVFTLLASREISEGEQLHTSYNQCDLCRNRVDSYGTPFIFYDYGFVEDYPRRFVLLFDYPQIARVKFDIAYDIEQDKVVVVPHTPLDSYSLEYISTELERLEAFESAYVMSPQSQAALERKASMPRHEWEMTARMHAAYVEAFSALLEASKHMEVSDDIWDYFGDHEWYVESELQRYEDGDKPLLSEVDQDEPEEEKETNECDCQGAGKQHALVSFWRNFFSDAT